MSAFVLDNQAARTAMLQKYQILDSPPEQPFDDLVNLAAQLCDTPMAIINLMDRDRQWFKAKVGIDIEQAPANIGFCPICVASTKPLIIPDTLAVPEYAVLPFVVGEPYIRFYAGVPLVAEGGVIIGTICVFDTKPRQLSVGQIDGLTRIARLIMRQLDLRLGMAELENIKAEYETAKTALKNSECTLLSFFDNTPLMMGIVEVAENDILHISDNQATANFFGLTPATMANRFASELGVKPEILKLWLQHYHYALSTGESRSFEYVHNIGNRQHYFKATVTSIGSCCHPRNRCAYVLEDITAHKLADLELEWKEALLRSMTDVSPLAFYVVDSRTDQILYCNQRFCDIWQIPHLVTDLQSGKLSHQDVTVNCMHLVADGEIFRRCSQSFENLTHAQIIEAEIPLVDGRIIRHFGTQIRDRHHQYLGNLCIFEDITARKRHEQQIREQAALLDITTDAIILRDLSNRIVLWNHSAEKIYGWEAGEVFGKNATDVLFQTPKPELADIYNQVLKEGAWQGELRKITKTGKEIIVESRWTLVLDEHLQPKSILTVDTDITQAKELENQFLRIQRMESIGTLASGIAHDLNNVLSPILMATQVLQLKTNNPELKPILEIIENNTKRGASLVKQVLSFARGMEGDRTTIQVPQIIQEIQQIIEQTFPKTINIQTEIQPEVWQICGDSTQIHQILINLCLNARDAMPEGGHLTITAKNITIDENYTRMNIEARVGSYVQINISDTGCGIPKDKIDRIFEPFFTTKEFGKGTGLGLSTVLGIVKGHQGFINVSSQIGVGTIFKVYLPAMQTQISQTVEPPQVITGAGEWILVVDDEQAIREITQKSLIANNYQVIVASDGIEAIAIYAQHKDKIRAAIIDMMMPNMDGSDTIHTLRKMNPHLPVVLVSGLVASSQIYHNMQDSQLTQFLAKPYTTSELLTKLHLVIRNS